jgi:hypothetical protein
MRGIGQVEELCPELSLLFLDNPEILGKIQIQVHQPGPFDGIATCISIPIKGREYITSGIEISGQRAFTSVQVPITNAIRASISLFCIGAIA